MCDKKFHVVYTVPVATDPGEATERRTDDADDEAAAGGRHPGRKTVHLRRSDGELGAADLRAAGPEHGAVASQDLRRRPADGSSTCWTVRLDRHVIRTSSNLDRLLCTQRRTIVQAQRRRGVAVTQSGVSTKLLYVGPD